MYNAFFKRVLDIILSLAGWMFASWLYLLIMIAIKIDDPVPFIFTYKRI